MRLWVTVTFVLLAGMGLHCKREKLVFDKMAGYLVRKQYDILLAARHPASPLNRDSLNRLSAKLDSLLHDPNLTVGPLPDRIISGLDEDTGLFDITYLIRINDPEGTYFTYYLVVVMMKAEDRLWLYDIRLSGGIYY